jgi:hypothetical protein
MVMEGLEAAEAQSKPPPVPDAEYSVPTADRRYEEVRYVSYEYINSLAVLIQHEVNGLEIHPGQGRPPDPSALRWHVWQRLRVRT